MSCLGDMTSSIQNSNVLHKYGVNCHEMNILRELSAVLNIREVSENQQ